MKLIRKLLMRSSRFRRIVADYQRRQKDQHYKERWARLLHSGGTWKL